MISIARRDLLRAAGAGALLGAYAQNFPKARAATAPKRLIVWWNANGAVQENFWPSGGGSNVTSSRILEPLGVHKGALTVIKDITFGGTGDHKTGMPFCTSAIPTANAGPSIDQVVAAAGGKPALVVTGQSKSQNYRGYISYDKNGANVTPVRSPKTAFETIFGPAMGPGMNKPPPAGGPAGYGPELQKKILETAISDVEEVRKNLSAFEKSKMDNQLKALNGLAASLQSGMGMDPLSMPVSVDCKDVDGSPFVEDNEEYKDRIRLHADVTVAAFACDLRRSASIMLSPGGHDSMNFGFLGIAGGDIHNNVAHKISEANNRETMTKIAVWQAEQLAYLIKRLKDTPDVDGKSLFDNTTILWTTECMDGNHGHRNIPTVVVGGGGMLKNGALLMASNVAYADILMAVARAAGHAGLSKFGEKSTGPWAGLMA